MAWSGNSFDPIFAEIWAKEVERAAEPLKTMRRFCVVKEDLVSNPGDTIWISKFDQLTGNGIAAGTDIEGNEQDYSAKALGLVPAEVKNGVKVRKSEIQKTPVALRMEAATALGNWYARKEDSDIWTAAVDNSIENSGLYSGSTDTVTTNVYYGGDATTRATVEATDTMTSALLRKAAAKLASNNAPKFIINGIACYVGILHPRQVYDLKGDTDYKNAQKDAGLRGNENRLFTGAIGMYDGILLFESTQTSTASGWGCPALTVYQGVVFGERALCMAVGLRNNWMEKEFDYGRLVGMATESRYMAHILNYKHIVRLETAATTI